MKHSRQVRVSARNGSGLSPHDAVQLAVHVELPLAPGQQARKQDAEPAHPVDAAYLAAYLAAQDDGAQLPLGVVAGCMPGCSRNVNRCGAAEMILLASFSG